MPTFAMMSGNTVENIIVADDKKATEAALGCVLIELIEGTPCGFGWTFDEETEQFVAPPSNEQPE